MGDIDFKRARRKLLPVIMHEKELVWVFNMTAKKNSLSLKIGLRFPLISFSFWECPRILVLSQRFVISKKATSRVFSQMMAHEHKRMWNGHIWTCCLLVLEQYFERELTSEPWTSQIIKAKCSSSLMPWTFLSFFLLLLSMLGSH